MRAYFDGSWVPVNPSTGKVAQNAGGALFSWGLVFDGGDVVTELNGVRTVKHPGLNGTHEIQAFVECALYCVSHNIAPEDVSFTTDDEITVYGSKATVANGYAVTSHSIVLEEMLVRLVKHNVYDQTTIESIRPYLERSRMTKVKGHSNTFWNLRCDYLANVAAKSVQNGAANLESVARWAKRGFVRYVSPKKSTTWFPAFHSFLVTSQEAVTL